MSFAAALACGKTTISIEADHEPESEPTSEQGPGPDSLPEPEPESQPSEGPDAVASVPTPSEAEPDADLLLGLLAYFPFDETAAGATVVDASGNEHDGTPSTNPPLPSLATPAVGFDNPRCLAFDGIEQLVDLGNPETLDVSGSVTISAWIRPIALDGYRNIVAHGYRMMPDQELALRLHDGYYEFLVWGGAMINHRASAEIPAGDVDNWHHLAGVYDGQTYRLYRDGTLVAEQDDSVAPSRIDAPWAIGGRSATMPDDGRHFEGLIDEVRIYGRALSEEQVRVLFRR